MSHCNQAGTYCQKFDIVDLFFGCIICSITEEQDCLTAFPVFLIIKIMSTVQKLILSFAITLTLFALGFMFVTMKTPKIAEGSVSYASEYHSTTTRTAIAGVVMQSYTALGICGSSLGSIVVTGANTGIINLYDSTTTAAHSDYATSTLAVIPASMTAGTYTFDVALTHGGVVFELVSGLMPTTTITCR